MKKRLLPIVLLATLGITACAPGETTTSTPSSSDTSVVPVIPEVKTLTITNKDKLKEEWRVEDPTRSVSITTDPAINIAEALKTGTLVISSSDTKIVNVQGKVLYAVAEGTAKITATYNKTVTDEVELTVLPKKGAMTIQEVINGIEDESINKKDNVSFFGEIVGTMQQTGGDNGQIHNGVYVQDGEYAMSLYAGCISKSFFAEDGTQLLNIGDKVYVEGAVDIYNGLRQVKPTTLRKMTADDKATLGEPTALTLTAENYKEDTLRLQMGRHVKVENLEYVSGGIKDATKRDDAMFKLGGVDVKVSYNYHVGAEAGGALKAKMDSLAPGNKVDMEGVISWFNGPAITPAFIGDKTPADLFTVHAQPDPTKLTISGDKTVPATKKIQLSVAAEPAGASPAVTWTTSDDKIATVDTNGRVTGVAEGKATITATSKKVTTLTATYEITVTKAPVANGPVVAKTFVDGGTYKFGINLDKNDKTGFLKAAVENYKFVATENYDEADNIVVNAVEGGYKLTLGGKVLGISRTEKADKPGQYYNNIAIDKPDAELVKNVWVYDEELNSFKVVFGEAESDFDTIYLGCRDTDEDFKGIGPTPKKFSKTNNLVRLYDYITTPTAVKEYAAGEFGFGTYNKTTEKLMLWDGNVNSKGYLSTVKDPARAPKVIITKDGDKYSVKSAAGYLGIEGYINSKGNLGAKGCISATPVLFTLDAKLNTLTLDVEAKKGETVKNGTFYIGAYGTFDTLSVSNVDYATKDGNFTSCLYSVPALKDVAGITISAVKNDLFVGQKTVLTAKSYPTASSAKVVYTSSDATKVSVEGNVATAVAAGSATITGKLEGSETIVATTVINVKAAPAIATTVDLTVASLKLAEGSYTDSYTGTVDGLALEGKQLGNYGDGIQLRDRDGIRSVLYNTTATSKEIVAITFVYNSEQNLTALDIYFGSESVKDAKTGAVHIDAIDGEYTYTVYAPAGTTFFKIEDTDGHSAYLSNIKIGLAA